MKKKILLVIASFVLPGAIISAFLLSHDAGRGTWEGSSHHSSDLDWFFSPPNSASDEGSNPVESYLRFARFPPWSRPLREGMVDAIEPAKISLPYADLNRTDPSGRLTKTGFSCLFQPESHTVAEGEIELATLSCYQGDPETRGDFRELRIGKVTLEKHLADRIQKMPSAEVWFDDSGREGDRTAGDHEYTFRFRPGRTDWGDFQLSVEFEISGDNARGVYQSVAQFFSSPIAPAVFTENISDRLEKGSLYVQVEVNVRKAGHYRICANIGDSNQHLATARVETKLAQGIQKVDLVFYGLHFAEAKSNGPYLLTALRGYRRNLVIDPDELNRDPRESARALEQVSLRLENNPDSVEPDREVIPSYRRAYQTKTYALPDFLTTEWDSPEKQEKLRVLREMQE